MTTNANNEPTTGRVFLAPGTVRAYLGLLTEGTIFSVVLEKKDGTLRRMVGRKGVRAHLAGGVATYNGVNNDKGNVGIFDVEAGEYRCFNISRVVCIKGAGDVIGTPVPEILDAVINAKGETINGTGA